MIAPLLTALADACGLCGKFGNKLFTATVVRARRKNAGIAGPTSSFFNAALAAVAKKSVIELSKQPTERRFVVANIKRQPTALLVVVLLSWQIASCGILTEVPENLHDYPTDFARFLSKNGAHGDYEDFVYFLKSHDVHQIVPVWQLLQQGSEWEKHQLPKYALPPRQHWNSMVSTLVFLKYDLIPYIGDVKVLSGFRTPHYNKLAGGAGKSRHLSFSALDLRPVAKIDRSQLHGILQNRWHSFGNHYNLGLGLYASNRFHIDTGGFRQW